MDKACPVILKTYKNETDILCFSHPLAGNQLVKGGIRPDETLTAACERELLEEAGIAAKGVEELGVWQSGYRGQEWGFCLMEAECELVDSWKFFAKGDGGQLYRFFWQPLSSRLLNASHPVFERARTYLDQKLHCRMTSPPVRSTLEVRTAV